MPIAFDYQVMRCCSCGKAVAEASALIDPKSVKVDGDAEDVKKPIVPVGIRASAATLGEQETVLFSSSQSFELNPLPRSFEWVLVHCLHSDAALEVGPDATTEHTWFEGFAHRILCCASCGDHVGWSYRKRSGEEVFGLCVSMRKTWVWVLVSLAVCLAVYQCSMGNVLTAMLALTLAVLKLFPHIVA
eukprot:TRINITY_DN80504_c0_g1_i2.p1 TRINITY_DN80504_c0_g1~~TRINITY_DN80504_c0_g1_i2.p1  ORF type:complete len:213 (+),score=32.25 TRINITY_DN80504_c0_g1_i2:76-639(+)